MSHNYCFIKLPLGRKKEMINTHMIALNEYVHRGNNKSILCMYDVPGFYRFICPIQTQNLTRVTTQESQLIP